MMIQVYYLTHSAIDEIVILHIMNWNDIGLQVVRNAYLIGHALDINSVVLHRAACAIDACRVGAYAIGCHGNSWAFQVLRIAEFAGEGGPPMSLS